MREIKFQLYNDEDNRMEKVTGMEWNEGHSAWICSSDFEGESSEWNVPMIIRQYTGLKDCDGVEIYEGDLIQLLKPKSKDFATVDFINAYVGGWVLTHKDTDNVLSLGARNPNELKVIGNIHQNQELIK